jgi:hypothetical protein
MAIFGLNPELFIVAALVNFMTRISFHPTGGLLG